MNKCVLIYDDDKVILDLCKAILRPKNYQVETRERCENIIQDALTLSPDLILIDLWIPEIGGEKAINLLRENENFNPIPVIIFSADTEIAKIAHRAKAQGYIEKPFDIHKFLKLIEDHFVTS
jgi:DNA-binding response OmpR family regulator